MFWLNKEQTKCLLCLTFGEEKVATCQEVEITRNATFSQRLTEKLSMFSLPAKRQGL